jgi:CRISPR-associated protein Cst1
MSDTVRYVGDPFVDAGVAVLEYRTAKQFDDLDNSDLRQQAAEIEELYGQQAWRGYLTVHFPNSGWCNATMSAENKAAFRNSVLRGFDVSAGVGRLCAYCSRPAQHIADRSMVPLLTGAATMTTGAGGAPGLPICGYCLFAIQFYPLATVKVHGRPLFWWTHDPEWMRLLTRQFGAIVQQVTTGAGETIPNLSWPSTQLFRAAWRAFENWSSSPPDGRVALADIIGCHVTNYGSGPDYEELHIPRSVLEFWWQARAFPIYREIVRAAWEIPAKGKPKEQQSGDDIEDNLGARNRFYEDMGRAFRNQDFRRLARSIASRYFIRPGLKKAEKDRRQLAEYFLEEVAGMERARLDAIRLIADRIADSKQTKQILDRMFRRTSPRFFISTLVYAQDRMARAHEPPLPTDQIHTALNVVSTEEPPVRDAWLVRELMLLRILERMAESQTDLNDLPEVATVSDEELAKGEQ